MTRTEKGFYLVAVLFAMAFLVDNLHPRQVLWGYAVEYVVLCLFLSPLAPMLRSVQWLAWSTAFVMLFGYLEYRGLLTDAQWFVLLGVLGVLLAGMTYLRKRRHA